MDEIKRKIGISDFSTKPPNYYNLDDYRVESHQGGASSDNGQ